MRCLIPVVLTLTTATYSVAQEFEWAGLMARVTTNSVHTDENGNVYTTGKFSGVVDFDPGAGETNLSGGSASIFLQKLNETGALVWAIHMSGGINADGFSVATDNASNVYVTGYFRGTVDFDPGAGTTNLTSTTPTFNDLFILKLDVNGNLVWVKQLKNVYDGMPDSEIAVDGDGSVYCTGFYEGVVDFDPGINEHNVSSGADFAGFVLKLTTSGEFDWVNSFSSISSGYDVASDGTSVYVTGYFLGTVGIAPPAVNLTSKGGVDCFLMKLTTEGDYVWSKQIGGAGDDYARSIALDLNGNVFIVGEFDGTPDFNLGGTPSTLSSAGQMDIFVQKFNPAGNMLWVKQIGGSSYDGARDISVTNSGDLFVGGQFTGTASFGFGTEPESYSTTGGTTFILNVTPAEEIGWVVQYKTNSLYIDAVGESVYTAGKFFGTIDFDPGDETTNTTADPVGSAFVVKLTNEMVTAIEDITPTRFTIYPNPVESVAFVDIEINSPVKITMRVRDVLSRIVKEQVVEYSGKNQIDMTDLSGGLYIIELTQSGKKVGVTKLIKN